MIRAINCSHVLIKSPAGNEEAYVNIKGIHTINVQAVCDTNIRLCDVAAKWPGGTHDFFIWRSSSLHHLFEEGHLQRGWLYGMFSTFCILC